MKKAGKQKKQKKVKLLRFERQQWRIVDYGVPGKAHIYTAMGYVVQWE